MTQHKSRGVWDASECALLLIDYQEHVLNLYSSTIAPPPALRIPTWVRIRPLKLRWQTK